MSTHSPRPFLAMSLALALGAALGAAQVSPAVQVKATQSGFRSTRQYLQDLFGGRSRARSCRRPRGKPWTSTAIEKRKARKRRNVMRERARR